MVKKYGDIYSGIFLMVFALIMFIGSFSIKMLTVSKIGSAFVPQLTAGGIFLVAIFIVINGIKQKRALDLTHQESSEGEEQEEEKPQYRSVVLSLILMIAYLAFMEAVGFLIMTFIYLFLQIYLLADQSQRKIPMFLLISIITSVAIYYVFRSVFHVMLPSGILG